MDDTDRLQRREQVMVLVVSVVLGATVGGSFAFFANRGSGHVSAGLGLVTGVLFAVWFMVGCSWAIRRNRPTIEAVAVLTKDERREVGRAVSAGRAVTDHRLARAAALSARRQLGPDRWRSTLWRSGVIPAAGGAFILVINLLTWQPPNLFVACGLLAVGGLNQFTRHRARRAEAANQALAAPA